MNPFTYSRAADADQAVTAISSKPQGKFLGGGTNLNDLMKMGMEQPNELIDINRLPLGQIEELPDKGLRIGALASNSDVAKHELIKTRYPVFFFQAEDGIRDLTVTGVQTCALPI